MRILAQRKFLNPSMGRVTPFDGPMVLFDDIVEIRQLAQRDGKTTVGLDADDGRLVGSAPIDGDFLWHVVQPDRPFEKRSGRSMIA